MPYYQTVNIDNIIKKYGGAEVYYSPGSSREPIGLEVHDAVNTGQYLSSSIESSAPNVDDLYVWFDKNRIGTSAEFSKKVAIGKKAYVFDSKGWVLRKAEPPAGMMFFDYPEMKDFDENDARYYLPVAYLIKNTLHLTVKFPNCPASREIYRDLIDRALAELKKQGVKLKMSAADKKKVVVDFLLSSHEREIQLLVSNIEKCQENARVYLSHIVNEEKELVRETRALAALRDVTPQKANQANELFDYAAKCKTISEISVVGGNLQIITQNLSMRYGDKVVQLPPYRVVFGRNATEFRVYADDFCSRIENCNPHPHILRSGSVCLGNYTTIFAKIVRSGNYKQLIDLVLQFLETYNDESPYTRFRPFSEALSRYYQAIKA